MQDSTYPESSSNRRWWWRACSVAAPQTRKRRRYCAQSGNVMATEPQSHIIRREDSDRPLPDPCPGGFSRYEDFAPLTEGGGATLKTGVDSYFGRRVVFKKLLPEFRDDPVMLQRFVREARVTALIQHPATAPVYEMGRDDQGTPYFTMKKVSGHSLQEILQGIAAHDPAFRSFAARDQLVDIVIQVGQAIASAPVSFYREMHDVFLQNS